MIDLETSESQQQYIDALYDLAQIICGKNEEVRRLEHQINKGVYDQQMVDDLFSLKATLIGQYTQRIERGGLN